MDAAGRSQAVRPAGAPEAAAPASAAPARLQDIAAAPVFTAFTVAPELRNRAQVATALSREYPRLQRAGSPQGQVLVWLLLDESGTVRKTQLKQSSGHAALDEAALQLGRQMRFSPALEHDHPVPVWVSVPVDFVTR